MTQTNTESPYVETPDDVLVYHIDSRVCNLSFPGIERYTYRNRFDQLIKTDTMRFQQIVKGKQRIKILRSFAGALEALLEPEANKWLELNEKYLMDRSEMEESESSSTVAKFIFSKNATVRFEMHFDRQPKALLAVEYVSNEGPFNKAERDERQDREETKNLIKILAMNKQETNTNALLKAQLDEQKKELESLKASLKKK